MQCTDETGKSCNPVNELLVRGKHRWTFSIFEFRCWNKYVHAYVRLVTSTRVLLMHRNAFLFPIFSIFPRRIDTPQTFVHSHKQKCACLERSCSTVFYVRRWSSKNSNVFSNTILLSWIQGGSQYPSLLLFTFPSLLCFLWTGLYGSYRWRSYPEIDRDRLFKKGRLQCCERGNNSSMEWNKMQCV